MQNTDRLSLTKTIYGAGQSAGQYVVELFDTFHQEKGFLHCKSNPGLCYQKDKEGTPRVLASYLDEDRLFVDQAESVASKSERGKLKLVVGEMKWVVREVALPSAYFQELLRDEASALLEAMVESQRRRVDLERKERMRSETQKEISKRRNGMVHLCPLLFL